MLDDRPGQTESIIRARAAADFIQDDQTTSGGRVENSGCLDHFHHEGTLTAQTSSSLAPPVQDSVGYTDACPVAGTKLPSWAISVISATCRM